MRKILMSLRGAERRSNLSAVSRLPRFARNDNPGVSLVISIIFVSALMLITADLAQVMLAGIRMRGNWEASSKAFYLAEASQGAAEYWAGKHGAGANSDDSLSVPGSPAAQEIQKIKDFLYEAAKDVGFVDASGASTCGNPDGNTATNDQCVSFGVIGRSGDGAKFTFGSDTSPSHYSVPLAYKESGVIKSTGSAEEKCVDATNEDDPCHWNKIGLGEAVEIPLYYENAGVQVKPTFGDPDSFVLRVRTPCGKFENSACTENVKLFPKTTDTTTNPQNFRNIDRDPVLIQWMIVDEGGDDTLIAADKKDTDKSFRFPYTDIAKNTELSAGRVNYESDFSRNFEVLQADHNGTDLLAAGSTHPRVTVGNFVSRISKPILRLTLVERPKIADCPNHPPSVNYNEFINDTSCDIPYLEWQLLTKDPIADSKSFLIGVSVVGDFRKELSLIKNRPVSLGGFAMESF